MVNKTWNLVHVYSNSKFNYRKIKSGHLIIKINVAFIIMCAFVKSYDKQPHTWFQIIAAGDLIAHWIYSFSFK